MSKPGWLTAAPISATNKKADTKLFPFLIRLVRGENLPFDDAREFFLALTDHNADAAQMAGALAALTTKGETADEIAGMTAAMNQMSVKVSTRVENITNISGTGSSSAKTFNVSTAAAFVAAGAGLPVAKNTVRGSKTQIRAAEVLERLNVKVAVATKVPQACLNGAGICFLFETEFHPSSRRLKDISRNMGITTCLNLLEALANPANAPKQLIGVWHPSLISPVANALKLLGVERGWVVFGADGLDELTLSGDSFVSEVSGGNIRMFKVRPEDFGLRSGGIDHLKAATPQESAKIIMGVLKNKRRDEARSLIVLNAAAALFIGGLAREPKKATLLAEQSIDSGSALTKLERLVNFTNKKK